MHILFYKLLFSSSAFSHVMKYSSNVIFIGYKVFDCVAVL